MKAKLFLATVTAVSLLATTAMAQLRYLSSNGVWKTFITTANNRVPMCGIETIITDRSRNEQRAIFVKYQHGTDYLFIQLYKASWRWTEHNVAFNATVSFDAERLEAPARAYSSKMPNGSRQGYVEIRVAPDFTGEFLELFAESDRMTIEFHDGNEPNWGSRMEGSRAAVKAFTQCVARLNGNGEVSTRPFGGAPKSGTTPFNKGKPAPIVAPKPDDRSA